MDRGLARFLFWGRYVSVEVVEGGLVCYENTMKEQQTLEFLWDGEIDNTKIEGRKVEKV